MFREIAQQKRKVSGIIIFKTLMLYQVAWFSEDAQVAHAKKEYLRILYRW